MKILRAVFLITLLSIFFAPLANAIDIDIAEDAYPTWVANNGQMNDTGTVQGGTPAAVYVTFSGLTIDSTYYYWVGIEDEFDAISGRTYNDSTDTWIPIDATNPENLTANKPYFTADATSKSFFVFFRLGNPDDLLAGEGEIYVYGGNASEGISWEYVDIDIGDQYDMGVIEGIQTSSTGRASIGRMAIALGSGPFGFYPTEPNDINEGYPYTPGYFRIAVPTVMINQLQFRDENNTTINADTDSTNTWYPTLTGIEISGDVTWDEDMVINSPYIITESATLTIESGTVIKFGPNGMLDVYGELYVNGTAADSIFFTSINDDAHGTPAPGSTGAPAPGDWKKVLFRTWSYGEIYYANFLYGGVNVGRSGVLDIQESAPIISNCRFAHNILRGIHIGDFGSPEIKHSRIEQNLGGGIFVGFNANPFISNNLIQNNTASFGAGIVCLRADPFITRNTITNNTAVSATALAPRGGGIACGYQTEAVLIRNTITNNSADPANSGKGGGIYMGNSYSYALKNNINNNQAGIGGGIFYNGSFGDIERNLIHSNLAPQGAAMAFQSANSDPDSGWTWIDQNTIADNNPNATGSSIYVSNAHIEVNNTIAWGNGVNWLEKVAGTAYFYYSCLPSGANFLIDNPGDPSLLIGEDPLFTGTGNIPYELQDDSPCIDAGDPEAEPDLDGTPRDIGAFPNYCDDCNLPPQIDDNFWGEFPEDQVFHIVLDNFVEDLNHDLSELDWTYTTDPQFEVEILTDLPNFEGAVARVTPEEDYVTPFDPENWDLFQPDSIVFTVADPEGATDTASFYFFIFPVIDPPSLNVSSTTFSMLEDEQGTVNPDLSTWVTPSEDVSADEIWWWGEEGDSLWAWVDYSDDNTPIQSAIVEPWPDWHGQETITFFATDYSGWLDSVQVAVTVESVNDLPMIYLDEVNIEFDEDGTYSEDLDNFVEDADHSNDQLTWAELTNNRGTYVNVDIDPETHVITLSADPDWYGPETIWLQVSDPEGGSDTLTVNVFVYPVNDPPQFTNNAPVITFAEDDSLTILMNPRVNDIDHEMADLIFWGEWTGNVSVEFDSDTGPQGGTIHRALFFGPENWFGQDSVKIFVSDYSGGVDSATVHATVTAVNDAPQTYAIDDIWFEEDMVYTDLDLDDHADDVDHDLTDLTWSVGNATPNRLAEQDRQFGTANSPPARHSRETVGGLEVVIDPQSHEVTITPELNWSGAEEILFIVTDPEAASDSVWAYVQVTPVNDPPEALPIEDISFAEDTVYDQLYLDDFVTDVDNSPGEMIWWEGTIIRSAHIDVEIDNETYQVTFMPYEDWFGTETVKFIVSDPDGEIDSTTVDVTVDPVNDPPFAEDMDVFVNEDSTVDFELLASDVDNTTLTFTLLTTPEYGELTGDPPNLTYTPDLNYSGFDTFNFVASDAALSDTGVVYIYINPEDNQPPTAADQSVETDEDQVVAITLSGDDPNNDPITFDITEYPTHGQLTPAANRSQNWMYTPDPDFFGDDSFQFVTNDGSVNSPTATVQITIISVNDPPQIDPIDDVEFTPGPGNVVTVDIYVFDVDDENLTLGVTGQNLVNAQLEGTTLTLSSTANITEAVNETLTVTVTDPEQAWASQEFTVTLLAPGDLDGDGELNETDVVDLAGLVVNPEQLTPELAEAADVNNDGMVNILDILYLIDLINQ